MADTSQAPARFLASARKYRPQTFGDLVAQEHVATTLRNAIAHDRLSHAYLFSGPRGVGKTTAARLLAKAINCETPLADREAAEPCRTCSSCKAFEEGRDLNVIELDAASNNSVDDIRDLRETVRIPPQGGRKKVYILDEVHMLSTQAFNAFLKTLEEPPPHALFIFATTEPHKVLPTILSRCQRFDFRRISIEDSVERLREIAREEGVTADDASLHLIARKGDGALRDALSLFDQAVALCGTDLRIDDLSEALGVVDADLYFDCIERIAERDTAALLRLVDTAVRRGYDLAEFIEGLSEHLRHLYVVVSTGGTDLVEADTDTKARYSDSAHGRTEADLLRMMMVLEDTERNLRTSPQPRLTVELALLKLAHLESATDLQGLIDRLSGMEASGGAEQRSPKIEPKGTSEPPSKYRPPPRDEPPPGSHGDEPPPPRTPSPPPSRPAASVAPASPSSDTSTDDFFGTPALKKRRSRPEGGDGSAAATMVPEPSVDEDESSALEEVRSVWPRLVARAEAQSPRIAGYLSLAQPEGTRGRQVSVAVPHSLARQTLAEEQVTVSDLLRDVLGEDPPDLTFVVRLEPAETAAESDPFEIIRRMRHEHPTVKRLFDRFGAEIVWT